MTVTVNEILELFQKAELYDVEYGIVPCFTPDYVIYFEYGKSRARLYITDGAIVSPSDFDTIDQLLNHMSKQFKERTKEQKRKELLARLTDEEKELLGLSK
jgi:hypothetical protein